MWLQSVGSLNLLGNSPIPSISGGQRVGPGTTSQVCGVQSSKTEVPRLAPLGTAPSPSMGSSVVPLIVHFEDRWNMPAQGAFSEPGASPPDGALQLPPPCCLTPPPLFLCSVVAAVWTGTKFGHEMNSGEHRLSRLPFQQSLGVTHLSAFISATSRSMPFPGGIVKGCGQSLNLLPGS